MAETQPQPNYQYTPPSAKSTRHLIDSTSPSTSTSTNTNKIPSRPPGLTRKSTNYAVADAEARAALAEAHASAVQSNDPDETLKEKAAEGTASASASWKPKYGRKQSWSQQDFKREMHMTTLGDEGTRHGYTEAKKESQD